MGFPRSPASSVAVPEATQTKSAAASMLYVSPSTTRTSTGEPASARSSSLRSMVLARIRRNCASRSRFNSRAASSMGSRSVATSFLRLPGMIATVSFPSSRPAARRLVPRSWSGFTTSTSGCPTKETAPTPTAL